MVGQIIPIRFSSMALDATGSILKNANQKQVKLYTIVAYDKANHIYIPISEFFSNSNYSTDIGSYLYKIKHILQTNVSTKTKQIAPIIISDFDKAILNAVNEQFNNCNMSQYLKWSYNLLVEKKKIFNLMVYFFIKYFFFGFFLYRMFFYFVFHKYIYKNLNTLFSYFQKN